MHDAHGFDLVALVGAQMLFDLCGIGPGAPVAVDKDGVQSQFQGQFLPEGREMPRLIHQHRIAG